MDVLAPTAELAAAAAFDEELTTGFNPGRQDQFFVGYETRVSYLALFGINTPAQPATRV